ncbi:hypothetical protein BC939DRAFT_491384 [Gamsiella multidivaricata]|uniref:uncharacterized protein n=1 Tax=Gamsiella multidivaricata TaxID=101098 RepID=UPI00221FF940|nr:uncharacterized protein BC939DRAFT_491384 [Gamsiella multidivaricata]KAI7827486.1 hypothetical protein BC939DRAFT_491384 [Gamsiella multidivaricata]
MMTCIHTRMHAHIHIPSAHLRNTFSATPPLLHLLYYMCLSRGKEGRCWRLLSMHRPVLCALLGAWSFYSPGCLPFVFVSVKERNRSETNATNRIKDILLESTTPRLIGQAPPPPPPPHFAPHTTRTQAATLVVITVTILTIISNIALSRFLFVCIPAQHAFRPAPRPPPGPHLLSTLSPVVSPVDCIFQHWVRQSVLLETAFSQEAPQE